MGEKIGYIGLGIMGRPTALNLIRAGHELHVWARRKEATEPLVKEGATAHDAIADMAGAVDFIFTNVSDTPDVEEVLLGKGGVIEGARPGTIVIDMSTISPTATREMAKKLKEKDIILLDAPVSGGEKGAIDGTLSIMVGGEEAAFEKAKPVLEALGKTITRIGDSGAGQVAKACNQICVAQHIVAAGEAMLLAKSAGADPEKVRQALLGGAAGSKALEMHAKRMLDHDFNPGFKAKLHAKDMHIARKLAEEFGLDLPSAAMARELIDALVEEGKGELDSAAAELIQEERTGKSLT